jgi:uncharacterized protein YecT (DUF1311 family)
MKTLILLIGAIAAYAQAVDYPYKSAKDFKTLNEFPNTESFENSYGTYIQNCLDNTFGGTGGIPCLIKVKIWDRELNIQYKKLTNILPPTQRQLLKDGQNIWIKERDATFKLVDSLCKIMEQQKDGKPLELQGTASVLTESEFEDEMKYVVIMQRTLLLKTLFETRPDIIQQRDGFEY